MTRRRNKDEEEKPKRSSRPRFVYSQEDIDGLIFEGGPKIPEPPPLDKGEKDK